MVSIYWMQNWNYEITGKEWQQNWIWSKKSLLSASFSWILSLTTPDENDLNTTQIEYNRETALNALMISFLFVLGGQVQNKPMEIFRNDLCHKIVLDMRRPLLKMLAAVKDVEQPDNYDPKVIDKEGCLNIFSLVRAPPRYRFRHAITVLHWHSLSISTHLDTYLDTV